MITTRGEKVLRDLVAEGSSKSRRTTSVEGYVFPRAMLSREMTAKQRLSIGMVM